MIFTLEALQAEHGDCLILHYGEKNSPRFLLIDGGPDTVYAQSLKPRLEQLHAKFKDHDEKLTLEMVMVSHIDDDHINGILGLFGEMGDLHESNQPTPFEMLTLWFNSFDDVVGQDTSKLKTNIPSNASVSSVLSQFPEIKDEHVAAVVASVPQGQQLRDKARLLEVDSNLPFGEMIMRPEAGTKKFEWGDQGLQMTVLSPDQTRLAKLQKKWADAVEKQKEGDTTALAAAYSDQSVFNLSSIVVLVEFAGKTMLLTGDARGDHIRDGLIAAKLLKNTSDTVHFDLLKMPHHGSDRNVRADFFKQVTADHYIISANGLYDNPTMGTLEMIDAARGDAKYTIHLTNQTGKKNLEQELAKLMATNDRLAKRLAFRNPAELSFKVDLAEAVKF